jgi:hypothetical protein
LCRNGALCLEDLASKTLDDRSGGIGDDMARVAFGQSDQGGLAQHFVYGGQPSQQLLLGLARLAPRPFRHARSFPRRRTALL